MRAVSASCAKTLKDESFLRNFIRFRLSIMSCRGYVALMRTKTVFTSYILV